MAFNQEGQQVGTQVNVGREGTEIVIIVVMDGSARLLSAPRGTRVVIKDYDETWKWGRDRIVRDEHGQYREHVLERF